MSEWQPIETAPRDGSEFLAYDSTVKKMDVCHFAEPLGYVIPTQYDCAFGPLTSEFGRDLDSITHWMPLPEAPKKQENK